MLDPGLAFGTGTTNNGIGLEWLEGLDLQANRDRLLGCGSCILAIAIKLGAAKVIGRH